jgi:hypothetical protein
MKRYMFSMATFIGLGLVTVTSAWARGPAGGMGFGALAGTSNPPRAGHVTAPYGLYTARPYNPGPTYGPAFRSLPSTPSFPSTTIPQGAFPYRTNPQNPFGGPSYYYFRW